MFVLPFYRDDDSINLPIAVIGLIATNSCLWILSAALSTPIAVFARYGFVPEHPDLFTAITSMFIHAGFWHLAGNMWFLWMFGRRVERSIGPWFFLVLYLFSGLGGTLMHYAVNRGSTIPCVGASGAISGIVGAFFILFPTAQFDLEIYIGWWRVKRIPSRTSGAVGAWIGEQIILGILTQTVHFSSVAFWGHVGGFVVGFLGAILLKSTVTLDAAGFPIGRPWFHGPQLMSKAEITRLDIH